MLLMIFVNDFWTVKGVPHWMQHAKTNEDFLGLSDVVFPFSSLSWECLFPMPLNGDTAKDFQNSVQFHIF